MGSGPTDKPQQQKMLLRLICLLMLSFPFLAPCHSAEKMFGGRF
jgi:hypothetical protein